jgi:hypothetical protein
MSEFLSTTKNVLFALLVFSLADFVWGKNGGVAFASGFIYCAVITFWEEGRKVLTTPTPQGEL